MRECWGICASEEKRKLHATKVVKEESERVAGLFNIQVGLSSFRRRGEEDLQIAAGGLRLI